jgi:hypothetical protein
MVVKNLTVKLLWEPVTVAEPLAINSHRHLQVTGGISIPEILERRVLLRFSRQ